MQTTNKWKPNLRSDQHGFSSPAGIQRSPLQHMVPGIENNAGGTGGTGGAAVREPLDGVSVATALDG